MSSDIAGSIERFLALHQITDYCISRTRGDHGRVTFTHGGRTRFVIYSLTRGDFRSAKNVLSTIRHELGLVGVNTRARTRRSPRVPNYAGRVARQVMPAATPAPMRRHDDYRDVLAALLQKEGA
jgi:hypothetical protein